MVRRSLVSFLAAVLVCACSAPHRPEPGVSEYGGISEEDWREIAEHNAFEGRLYDRLRRHLNARSPGEPARLSILLLSGGGPQGAFGAGVLAGWPREEREAGKAVPLRPRFDLVSGVSTGALQATAAFLDDPELDRQVAYFYSTVTDDELYERNFVLSLLRRSGVTRYVGLIEKLRELYEPSTIERVAEAYEQGRTLWVGTCNMDTGAFQPWNLTYIASRAAQGNSDFYDLYIKILVASASIPTAVEPQYIHGYMHSDGGTRRNIFVPVALSLVQAPINKGELSLELYAIVNAKLGVRERVTDPRLLGITGRALEVMIDANVYASLLAIRASFAERLRADKEIEPPEVRLAFIPEDFPDSPEGGDTFDPEYMSELVLFGREFASNGDWFRRIPDAGIVGQTQVAAPDSEELEPIKPEEKPEEDD